jgi:hypothetical protein
MSGTRKSLRISIKVHFTGPKASDDLLSFEAPPQHPR